MSKYKLYLATKGITHKETYLIKAQSKKAAKEILCDNQSVPAATILKINRLKFKKNQFIKPIAQVDNGLLWAPIKEAISNKPPLG